MSSRGGKLLRDRIVAEEVHVDEERPGIWDPAHRRTTAGLLTLVTLIAFEAMAVGTAMPTAGTEPDGLAWYAWPFSAYPLAPVVGVVLGGEARDRRRPRVGLPPRVGPLPARVTLIALEAMAGGTAMPTAVTELDGLAWYAWPFSAYLVASVVGMVLGGEAGDRRGPRVALPLGVATFAAGLLVAGVATHMAVLVAGRAVQGLGAGVLATLLYVIAGQAYDGPLRPRLFGAISAAWVLPALVGPLIAGIVTTSTSWRMVFLGLLPFVLVGLLLLVSASRLPATEPPDEHAPRSRAGWALLAGVGIALLQYAGQRLDLVALAVAIAGGAALVTGLRRLLPRGTARVRRGLPAVVGSRGLLAGSFFGMDALLPLTLTALKSDV